MTDTFTTFNNGVAASMQAHEYRSRGDFEEAANCDEQAIESFDHVLSVDPCHTGALGGKGMSLAQLGRTQDAAAAFEAALAVEPMAEFFRQLGLCHVELGDMEKAWIVTRKAISLDDSPEYRENASSELLGLGNRILAIIEQNSASMSREQVIAYHQWAASTFALACDIDDRNTDARSILSSTEKRISQLSQSE